MKLYTEEQIKDTISRTLEIINSEKTWTYDDVINLLRPIELPSDKEIEEAAQDYSVDGSEIDAPYANGLFYGFNAGVKWYREQLKKK